MRRRKGPAKFAMHRDCWKAMDALMYINDLSAHVMPSPTYLTVLLVPCKSDCMYFRVSPNSGIAYFFVDGSSVE